MSSFLRARTDVGHRYKIYAARSLIDIGAFAPRDYTKSGKWKLAVDVHRYIVRLGVSTQTHNKHTYTSPAPSPHLLPPFLN